MEKELGFDLWKNPADSATAHIWTLMNRDLRHIAFRFTSPTRVDLFRLTDGRILGSWNSDLPLLAPDYDNVHFTASLIVRAVRVGSGLAVETSKGTAAMLTVMEGHREADLALIDESSDRRDDGLAR